MSSETIVTALFLIAAVVAAGVLINAIFPVISRTTETFGSVSHTADSQIRTDIKIVNYFAKNPSAEIWLKNIGSSRISGKELNESDIFMGAVGNFDRFSLAGTPVVNWDFPEDPTGQWWDPGETLHITINPAPKIPASGSMAYFAIVLPNGVKRSIEFVAD
jgi:archaeal flagellar protein FlaG